MILIVDHAVYNPAIIISLRKESITLNLSLLNEQMHAVYARKLAIQNTLHSALDISRKLSSTRGLLQDSRCGNLLPPSQQSSQQPSQQPNQRSSQRPSQQPSKQ